MNKQNLIIVGVLVFLLILAGIFLNMKNSQNPVSSTESEVTNEENQNLTETNTNENQLDVSPSQDATASLGVVKTFEVSGSPFKFSLTEIRVKKGDKVKIKFTNEEGMHDWVIDEFNARTPQIAAGKSAEVEFVADKTGTFEYYCSVGNHRAMGMKGNLIVE